MDSTQERLLARVPVTAHTILDAFDAAGLRSTGPRRIIAQQLAEYSARGDDFAIDELWQHLQRLSPRLGRATLFRAVDVLAGLGVLDRIQLSDGTPRYRVCGSGHHHHLICTSCHRIEEIDMCLSERDLMGAAERAGFDVDRHVLDLYGRCARCRSTSPQRVPSSSE